MSAFPWTEVGEMMKWWELFPTRYTSNMLFRPWVKWRGKHSERAQGPRAKRGWRSRAASVGEADDVQGLGTACLLPAK